MPSKKYEEFHKNWEERQNSGGGSFLIGDPIPWSDIKENENQKEWLWENYIAKGHITLLSALWKAGKSTLLRCLFLAMAEEQEFAGQPTKKTKVLVLSEEDKGDWSDKREDVNDDLIRPILVWSRPIRIKPNLKQWTELIEEVTERCKEDNINLVVIDTLTTFWPIDNENDSAQVIKALVPLYNFTENHIAVLLVHHFRKGGGDQAQASRGSGALPGFVDNIIEFTRNDNGSLYQRVLKTYGRFDGVIPSVVIELMPDGHYETRGDPWQVKKSARLQKLLELFKGGAVLSTNEVLNLLAKEGIDINKRTVQRYITEMMTENILFIAKTEIVVTKPVPFYALKEGFSEQLEIVTDQNTPSEGAVVSSSLSPTLSSTNQNRAREEDTTGTSVIEEIKSSSSKTEWSPNI